MSPAELLQSGAVAVVSKLEQFSGFVVNLIVNTYHAEGIGFTERNCVCFLKILTFHSLFQELLNQYKACWYLFDCISHGDSEYGNEIQQF